eukprot:g22049.t1
MEGEVGEPGLQPGEAHEDEADLYPVAPVSLEDLENPAVYLLAPLSLDPAFSDSALRVSAGSTFVEGMRASWLGGPTVLTHSVAENVLTVAKKHPAKPQQHAQQPHTKTKVTGPGDRPPTFMPDTAFNVCPFCEKAFGMMRPRYQAILLRSSLRKLTAFGMMRPRYHCGYCGSLVCNACSNNRQKLSEGGQAVRVCDKCFKVLNAEGAEVGAATDVSFTGLRAQEVQQFYLSLIRHSRTNNGVLRRRLHLDHTDHFKQSTAPCVALLSSKRR